MLAKGGICQFQRVKLASLVATAAIVATIVAYLVSSYRLTAGVCKASDVNDWQGVRLHYSKGAKVILGTMGRQITGLFV